MSQAKKVHHFAVHDIAIKSVTVFNDRAEVTRSLNVQLVPGLNEVLIEVKVLEEERKKLRSEKGAIKDREEMLRRRVEGLDKILMETGASVVRHPTDGRSVPFTLNDESLQNLAKFFSFYEDNSVGVRQKLRETSDELQTLDEKLRKIDDEIGNAKDNENYIRHKSANIYRHISVLLESAKGGEVVLDVSYQVRAAKWSPSYDIRIDSKPDQGSNMKLTYYGMIVQHTGEDWIDAPLVLSTAQPSLGGSIPELGTQIVKLYKPPPQVPVPQPGPRLMGLGGYNQPASVTAMGLEDVGFESLTELPLSYAETTPMQITAGDTNVSTAFVIARPATIPSDSSEHKVTVTSVEMKPTTIHETIPAKNTNVFLTASVLNSSQFILLPGQANVYLNNSFVAKSNIKAVSPNERFFTSLGVDGAVKVEYKPAHKFSEQVGLLSKCSSTVHEQRIVIKNTKNEKVLITVKEHVPKSTDEKIKIKLISPVLDQKMASSVDSMKKGELPTPGAQLNSAHNLEWTVALEPNSETELLVKWSVEHPNGETVEYVEQF
uniref:DUF4139 domain-containing protein n=1 Tax=Ascaris lumbricoides TaxID=6252 RepID=A0A0M3I5L1_ASCLU